MDNSYLPERRHHTLPENYKGITLQSSILNLFTSVIANISERYTGKVEEQQGFGKNKSTIYVIFIVRQAVEKSIKYYAKLAFICFVDLTKTFNKVKLQILKDTHVPNSIQKLTESLTITPQHK